MQIVVAKPSTERTARPAGAPLLALGGLAAAFGAASCCGLPIVLASAGVGTAWLGGIALLAAPVRPFLLVASAVGLASGAVLLWRQRTRCAPGSLCAHPVFRGLTLLGLVFGFVLLYLGYAYA